MASSETVTVGCKLPHGLLIRLGDLEEAMVDGKQVKMFRPSGREIELKGGNAAGAIGGYGLTHGVDADAWRGWDEAHKDFAPLARGLIFEVKRPADAAATAAERKNVKSGFEGIDPEKPGPKVEKRED